MVMIETSWRLIIIGACGMVLVILPLILLASNSPILQPKYNDRDEFALI